MNDLYLVLPYAKVTFDAMIEDSIPYFSLLSSADFFLIVLKNFTYVQFLRWNTV